jgi:hypothetical protein
MLHYRSIDFQAQAVEVLRSRLHLEPGHRAQQLQKGGRE